MVWNFTKPELKDCVGRKLIWPNNYRYSFTDTIIKHIQDNVYLIKDKYDVNWYARFDLTLMKKSDGATTISLVKDASLDYDFTWI